MSDAAPTMFDARRGQVGPVARFLGFAGLLPQFAALWLSWSRKPDMFPGGQLFAYFYGALILSFLGGMWWGFAMRRTAGQGRLVAMAVLPSLLAFFIAAFCALASSGTMRLPLVALGAALIATLAVDFHLFRNREAPSGWIALRVPLSVGLGVLTILAGLA